MKICVNYLSTYSVNASSIKTKLALSAGTHHVTVQAWDAAGAVYTVRLA